MCNAAQVDKGATVHSTIDINAYLPVLGLSSRRWDEPLSVLTHGQGDVRPKVTFLASEITTLRLGPNDTALIQRTGARERLAQGSM